MPAIIITAIVIFILVTVIDHWRPLRELEDEHEGSQW